MLWRSSAPSRRPEGFIEPCLPTLGQTVPAGPQWAYEIKHDGFRFICRRDGDRVRVFSRRGNDYTDRVPTIAKALAALRVKSVTLDGEGVVCREDGVSDFDRLRAAVGPAWARGTLFCMRSICLRSTAPTYAVTHGMCGGPRWRAFCGKRTTASDYPNTSITPMARRFSTTPARWVSRASSRSVAIGPIAPGARRIGSR
jgi:hypothetical protein